MGDIRQEASQGVRFESMEQKLMKEAMAKGADAMLIEKLDTTAAPGLNVTPNYYINSGGSVRPGGGGEKPIVRKDHIITAKLLKYGK